MILWYPQSELTVKMKPRCRRCVGSRPAFYKLIINRLCQRLMDTTISTTVAISLENKIESSRSVRLQMKCIITAGTILSLLTQCREEVRWLSLPSLVTFPTTMLHHPIDFILSCIHELVTVITSRHHPFLWARLQNSTLGSHQIYQPMGVCELWNAILNLAFLIACMYRRYV